MRLFNGTAEFVRADEIKTGDIIREEGEFRTVLTAETTKHEHYRVRIVCDDGYGFVISPPEQVLRKIV